MICFFPFPQQNLNMYTAMQDKKTVNGDGKTKLKYIKNLIEKLDNFKITL